MASNARQQKIRGSQAVGPSSLSKGLTADYKPERCNGCAAIRDQGPATGVAKGKARVSARDFYKSLHGGGKPTYVVKGIN